MFTQWLQLAFAVTSQYVALLCLLDLNTCSASDSTGSLLRSCGQPHSEDDLLDNSTEVCQQRKQPDYFFVGSVKLSLAPKSGGWESWHLDGLRISECPSYLFSSLSIQLWRRPSQSSCARKWDCVHFEPKVKSSLRKPDIEAYGVSGSHYNLLLGALRQMNVNSRSNITKRKQTYLGNWFDFFLPRRCMSPRYWDWISEGVYSPAPIQRKQLKWLCLRYAGCDACVCTFLQIELLLWNYLWLNMLCSKQD